MATLYELIGRIVVGFIRIRFRNQLRIAGASLALVAALIAFLLASRDVDEG